MTETLDTMVYTANSSEISGDNATYSVFVNGSLTTPRPPGGGRSWSGPLSGEVRIPLYTIIFFLAVIGNALVIITLAQNRRMRTVTNVFLINLSVSDLLLAVFCMPFTLIPTLLQDFIFGKAMCVLIRYMQGKVKQMYMLLVNACSNWNWNMFLFAMQDFKVCFLISCSSYL